MVTTNYDDLLENLLKLSTDNVFIGQSQLFNPKSVEVGELFKIHGCVTQSDDIVITEEDYEKFKKNAKLFTAKLLTLICENPVVFLGYSMSDPNVHQILTDLVECLTVKQISELRNHFYLINYKEGEQSLIEEVFQFKAKSYDGKELHFPITMISTDNYLEVYKQLSHLTPAMNIHTIKQVKRLLKDIVTESAEVTSDKETIMTILVDDIEKLSDEKRKFAVAIGGVKDISNYDHKTRPFTDIIEDILYENHNLNSERLISQTYEQSYLRNSMIVPIYKYKKDLLFLCHLTGTTSS